MKLHEFQSKKILAENNLPVPRGIKVDAASEIPETLKELQLTRGLIKAQAFTGGRGKAGGVKFFNNQDEAIALTKEMIGMHLITHQTGPEGVLVSSVLVEEPGDIAKEFYLAIVIDRANICPMMMISPDGGMDIEEIAQKTPERILKLLLPIGKELDKSITKQAASFLGLDLPLYDELAIILNGLYKVFCKYDATMLEINPLILTGDNKIKILDCKFDIDDNAGYRQLIPGVDPNAEKTPAEIEAAKWGMTYISLEGKIGCMVNGAGLAMATMDSIKHYGAEPANFLDVGGSASEEAVAKAFELISSDPNVECIFVNIFGGIMKCDVIAKGIIEAVKTVGLKFPLVVRLEGTNVEIGRKLLNDSGLNITSAEDLSDGAIKSVALLNSFSTHLN